MTFETFEQWCQRLGLPHDPVYLADYIDGREPEKEDE